MFFVVERKIKPMENILFSIQMSRMLWPFFGKAAAVGHMMSNLDAYEGVCMFLGSRKG